MKEADEVLLAVTQRANEVRKLLTGDIDQVVRMVRENDLVFAVWTDLTKVKGVGLVIVKGEELLDAVSLDGAPAKMNWTAIPCVGVEQAVVLRDTIGKEAPHRPLTRYPHVTLGGHSATRCKLSH